jgi:hypothetical protein
MARWLGLADCDCADTFDYRASARGYACLVMAALIVVCASADVLAKMPPTPIYRFLFDASRRDSRINEEVRIPEFRTYTFGLEFDYTNELDLYRVASLVGDGPGGRPGVPIPIHLQILQSDGITTHIVSDSDIDTAHRYRQGFSQKKYAGSFSRAVITINLKPGVYRIEANTLKATSDFSSTVSYFIVDYDPRAGSLDE